MKQHSVLPSVCLILIFAALVFFGYASVVSRDRLRFQLEAVEKSLEDLAARVDSAPAARTVVLSAADASDATAPAKAANAEFYDPAAEDGGTLTQAIAADTGNMNSLINNDATVSEFWSKCGDTLAELNWNDLTRFEPKMAESWSVSEDNATYRIKLRKGILWHDFVDPVTGKEWKNVEVTAHDFKFYVDVVKNPDVDALPLRGYLADLDRVVVFNDYEFDVVWKKPYFLSKEITLSLSPLPRHLYHAYDGPFDGKRFNDDFERNRMIVGCGPYRFVSWEKGKKVVFQRFEKYYGKNLGVMPPLRELVYEVIQHPNTRMLALKSGELDCDSLSPEQWINQTSGPEFSEHGFLRKIRRPGRTFCYIGLNQRNPLFQDRRVRTALSCLVDRDRIVRDVYQGLARPVSGPFFLDSPAYDKSVKPHAFDVEKAKRLLAEAGWRDTDGDGVLDRDGKKFQFTVMYPNVNANYQKMLPILKEDMAKAGVRLEILALEWSVVVERIGKRDFDASLIAWTQSLTPDPYQLWHSDHANVDGSSNYIGFSNPEADRLIGEIRVCFDEKKREELYHRFHRLLHEEAPYLFLVSQDDLFVVNRRFRNLRVFPYVLPTEILWLPRSERKDAKKAESR